MEAKKLEISSREIVDPLPASYKKIPEDNFKERPKSLTKSVNSNSEMDGADEQMLPSKDNDPDAKVLSDVKFSTNEKQNGEVKLDLGDVKNAFVGMSKEELMKYANDPFWVKLRCVLFVAFWVLWILLLAGAIVIIIAAPKCSPPTPRTWYEEGPLTEIENYDNDTLIKLKENKIKGVIVVKRDDSYKHANDSLEIVDYINSMKTHEINVIIELQPVTSLLWLNKSIAKEEKYADYYIWVNYNSNNESGDPNVPNHWISRNGQSSWQYSKSRDQFYYAPNGKPHLNFRNPDVVEEFSDVIRQWIDVGAKGFRLREVPGLLIDEKLREESISRNRGSDHKDYNFYNHEGITVNVEGIGDVLKQWKKVVREYNDNMGPLMIAEDLSSLDAYYVNTSLSFDLPRHSQLFFSPEKLSNATEMHKNINNALLILKNNWPVWQYNSSIVSPPADVLDILIMLLPGSPLLPEGRTVDPELVKIRTSPSIMFGTTKIVELVNGTLFAFARIQGVAAGNPGYLVAYNPTRDIVNVDFTTMQGIPDEMTVQVFSSKFLNTTNDSSKIEQHLKISSKDVIMPAKSAIVLTYVPKSK